ncbi:MAG: DUF5686 family protein [Bacteroidota bacterium]
MTLPRVLISLFLLLSCTPLFAQVTDTTRRTDTAVKTEIVIDTPVIEVKKEAPADAIPAAGTGYIIHGKAVDANTSEGVPFATIFFPRSQSGTTADLDGNFILKVDMLPSDTLRIEAMGYKAVVKKLTKARHDYNYIVELERALNALDEVVIHAGEDPAVVLLRKIIAQKPGNNPDRLASYQYEAYNKLEADLQRMSKEQFQKIPILKSYSFIFDNLDTVTESKPYLPMYLTETLSDYYYQRDPKKEREIIKASMVKGVNNENVVKYLGSLYQSINVYRNYIPVFDKKYVSPISNDALFYYKYKIKDTQTVYGHRAILVQFRPRRAEENCFTGDFWVIDSSYAIQRMSMDISTLSNINWVDKVSIFQEYAPVDSTWFCIKDKFIANFTFYNSRKLPGFIGRKTTTYRNIKLNQQATLDMINNPELKTDVVVADSAKRLTDEWWAKNRPDSLSKNEKAIYKMVDTINQMPITNFYKNTITFLTTGMKDIGPIQLGPYFYIYSFNPVEGHRFRFSAASPRSIKNAQFTGYVAYGTRDKRFKYGGTALWLLDRTPRMYLYGYFAHDIHSNNNYYDNIGSDNIFSNMFRKRGVPWKLAFAEDARLEFYKEYFNGFSHKLVVEYRKFSPYNPLPSYQIFNDLKGNPASYVTSSEAGVELRYAYKEKYMEGQYKRVTLNSKYPVVYLELSKGFKGVLNSGYDYHKARLSITERINIPPIGNLYYNVFAGKYFGTLPYPLLEIHPGNEFYYYNKYAFQMMNNYEFLSDQYTGFNIEHNIGGGIFNRIPLLKKMKLRQFWTAKGVIGTLSQENQRLNLNKGFPFRTLEGSPYLEVGTGVSNIFQLFRIDFVWRVTPKPLPTENKARYFGIFGSVRFEF